jgi:hypothetical protein
MVKQSNTKKSNVKTIVKTIDDIAEYLENYDVLWLIISQNDPKYPLMDISCHMIDDNNYYGVDFSGENAVYELFFTGQSNYGPVICFPKNKKVSLDECPIYIFDATGDNIIEKIGNFKCYMSEIIKDFINKENIEIEEDDDNDTIFYKSMANEAFKKLDKFSDKMINYDYIIKSEKR